MPSAQVSRANNIAVGVTISATSAQSATAPSDLGTTAVDRTCLARSYSRSVEIGTTDGGAFCDTEMKMVPTRKSGTLEMELIIPAAASTLFFGTEGYYCKVTADLSRSCSHVFLCVYVRDCFEVVCLVVVFSAIRPTITTIVRYYVIRRKSIRLNLT